MQDVKLRLGSINSGGEQKEVDSLLITDLIDLARNQSICDATLITGDSDVRVAMQIAQTFGVRVHLIGLEPSRVSQSTLLRQEADTVHEIPKAEICKFLTLKPVTARVNPVITGPGLSVLVAMAAQTAVLNNPSLPSPLTLQQVLKTAIERTVAQATEEDLARLSAALVTSTNIPQDYDRRLLGTCRTLLNRELTGDERREMRNGFKITLLSGGPIAISGATGPS